MFSKIHNKVNELSVKVYCGLLTLGGIVASQMPVGARAFGDEDIESTYSWLFNSEDNTLDSLTNKAKGLGGSAYKFMMVIGAIGTLLCIIILGLNFMFHGKNATKKDENKSALVYIAIGGIFIFGASAILGLIISIAKGL